MRTISCCVRRFDNVLTLSPQCVLLFVLKCVSKAHVVLLKTGLQILEKVLSWYMFSFSSSPELQIHLYMKYLPSKAEKEDSEVTKQSQKWKMSWNTEM